jgi:hypothetical protein
MRKRLSLRGPWRNIAPPYTRGIVSLSTYPCVSTSSSPAISRGRTRFTFCRACFSLFFLIACRATELCLRPKNLRAIHFPILRSAVDVYAFGIATTHLVVGPIPIAIDWTLATIFRVQPFSRAPCQTRRLKKVDDSNDGARYDPETHRATTHEHTMPLRSQTHEVVVAMLLRGISP